MIFGIQLTSLALSFSACSHPFVRLAADNLRIEMENYRECCRLSRTEWTKTHRLNLQSRLPFNFQLDDSTIHVSMHIAIRNEDWTRCDDRTTETWKWWTNRFVFMLLCMASGNQSFRSFHCNETDGKSAFIFNYVFTLLNYEFQARMFNAFVGCLHFDSMKTKQNKKTSSEFFLLFFVVFFLVFFVDLIL